MPESLSLLPTRVRTVRVPRCLLTMHPVALRCILSAPQTGIVEPSRILLHLVSMDSKSGCLRGVWVRFPPSASRPVPAATYLPAWRRPSRASRSRAINPAGRARLYHHAVTVNPEETDGLRADLAAASALPDRNERLLEPAAVVADALQDVGLAPVVVGGPRGWPATGQQHV
jgi:hypothetical protein